MYAGVPPLGALGAGGASALSVRSSGPGARSGFQTLATVVAATTLIMAGASVYKLLPRRRAGYVPSGVPVPARRNHAGRRDHPAPHPERRWVAVP
ncbi:hypothetical protein [Streptomyces yaizuensis]|uniref:MFS transporter n=1 Tax=Streptomyces yaizuensis TaxID=2989713 RepID=A0ABQ5NQI6_9ACTN|nr:hypothetical protein [Streptomyces sp. YSPA8]GLF92626.1 hypothetical protein SYYSPA8_00035 [Streptomyces sp. YSPA8]